MGRMFGLVLLLVSLYIGMTIYTRGAEETLSSVHRAFAPIQPIAQRETPLATGLTPAAGLADEPSAPARPVKVTDAVRNQVSSDLSLGASRRGYGAESAD
jgi:hypothetical protein